HGGAGISDRGSVPNLAGQKAPYLEAQLQAFKTGGWADAIPALLRNGDWDYAQFDTRQQRRETLNQAPCLACHQPLAAKSHVFTLDELTRHAQRQATR
ncbi:MAG: cytochrome P460 family protein, partial [Chitinophagaceae bacterium]|nr:cytochrome P460 family protein [Rubrivivax sp.]